MKPATIISLLVILTSLFLCGDSPGGKLYKWVDEKGVVHYSDRKPDKPEQVEGTLEEREVRDALPVEPGKDDGIKVPTRSPIEYAISCTFTIKDSKGMGTGFFISSSGYAVTSRHVVEGGIDPMAQLNDQSEYPIRVLAKSLQHDLALLLVLGPGQSPHLTLRNPRTLVPGERLFAIGTSAGLQATITDGIFTGFRKIKATDERVIQFSAPINPGNSGGPLIDEKGRVVGIVTWKFVKKKGIPVSGVGFAVPSGHITEEYGIYLE